MLTNTIRFLKKKSVTCFGINGFSALLFLLLAACVSSNTQPSAFGNNRPSLEARSLQTRTFSSLSKNELLSHVVEVLQENDFIVDKVNVKLGVVTATRFEGSSIRASVYVKNIPSAKQEETAASGKSLTFSVRINIFSSDGSMVTNGEEYQMFFSALSRRLSLSVNK